MEKRLQPDPIPGIQGNREQLGLRLSAPCVAASVWQCLQHLTPVTRTYALRSAIWEPGWKSGSESANSRVSAGGLSLGVLGCPCPAQAK